MGTRTRSLDTLAHSYISRGTRCVMTVSVERRGTHDFWLILLAVPPRYHAALPGARSRAYEVLCAVQDARVLEENGVVRFPAGLTLFDFVPPSVLEGVTRPDDEKAVELRMSLDQLNMIEGRLGGLAGREIRSQNIYGISTSYRKRLLPTEYFLMVVASLQHSLRSS